MLKRMSLIAVSLLVVASMLLAACAPSTPTPTEEAPATEPPESPTAAAPAEAAIDCMGAQAGDEVTMLYQWSGNEEEMLNEILAPLVDECGIVLAPESTRDHALLDTRVEAGTPPDIVFWTASAIDQYQDQLVPIDEAGGDGSNYAGFWKDMGSRDGKWLGLVVKADIKSIIWYSPAVFEAYGYAVPETWDELDALVEQMVADGNVPWSMGMESGDATGWTGSDFIQDILLVQQGPEYVLGLISGDVPYDDAGVKEAYQTYGKWAKDPKYTVGGAEGTLSTGFLDAIYKVFSDPPEAMMVKQSGFAGGAVKEQYPDLEYGVDYDFFGVPGAQGLQGGTDFMMVFNASPAAQAVVAYLTSAAGAREWAQVGFDLSPNSQAAGAYTDPALAKKAAILASATGFTPDIGDSIPGGFGKAEWKAIVDYVNDAADLDTALAGAAAVQAEALSGKPAIDCMGAQAGDEVTMLYQWSGAEEENLNAILAPLVDECGIVLAPESTRDHALLDTRVEAGTPPDIVFWTASAIDQYQDQLVPIDEAGGDGSNYAGFWKDMGSRDGKWLGLVVKADIKSIIWYSPAVFEAYGYAVPETWDELDALVEQMVADGNVPWSMGMESGDATGWTGSDFIQDILLVQQGPEYVLGLISGDVPYDDAGVKEAYQTYGKWAKDPKYTVGGAEGTLSTGFLDAIYKVFSDPPEAMMVKQSGFAGGAVKEQYPDLEYGVDYDFFGVPGAQGLQGGTDFMMVFNASPAAQAVVAYLTSAAGAREWAQVGFDLSPNSQAAGAYTDPALAKKAAILASATGFTPDIGDSIPGGFGKAEWKAIVDYVNDAADLDTALAGAAAVQAEATK